MYKNDNDFAQISMPEFAIGLVQALSQTKKGNTLTIFP